MRKYERCDGCLQFIPSAGCVYNGEKDRWVHLGPMSFWINEEDANKAEHQAYNDGYRDGYDEGAQ